MCLGTDGVAQGVQHLPSKFKALSSKPSNAKKQKQTNKKTEEKPKS
jgi:hypothetical protein